MRSGGVIDQVWLSVCYEDRGEAISLLVGEYPPESLCTATVKIGLIPQMKAEGGACG